MSFNKPSIQELEDMVRSQKKRKGYKYYYIYARKPSTMFWDKKGMVYEEDRANSWCRDLEKIGYVTQLLVWIT